MQPNRQLDGRHLKHTNKLKNKREYIEYTKFKIINKKISKQSSSKLQPFCWSIVKSNLLSLCTRVFASII